MSGSIYGKVFQIATWGESHGEALGVTIDGCPAGLPLSKEDIQKELDRRKPGQTKYSTPRAESDTVALLSGVFEGKTTGTPISLIIFNKDQHSKDYQELSECYRPGHADYPYEMKYGFRDYRGGGRSSGRETAGRVAAGAVAKKILERLSISIHAYTESIAHIQINPSRFDLAEAAKNPIAMPDKEAAEKAMAFLDICKQKEDSAGGVVACEINGLPAGIGEPVFDKLDACLGKALFSLGAVKGVSFGEGFHASMLCGSENNDAFIIDDSGTVRKETNHSGGVLGGMSDGSQIFFRTAFKATPSIHKQQKTVTKNGEQKELQIAGRHDPVIVPRAVVVVEAMAAVTLVDLLFQSMYARMSAVETYIAQLKG